ncbi:MAG: hypothetical protein M1829_002252 [Trizodia sp. TS-e1964]|nr:MAG: hypothetical protein M1829_002252 [Trizodia sp. TS-e1964]
MGLLTYFQPVKSDKEQKKGGKKQQPQQHHQQKASDGSTVTAIRPAHTRRPSTSQSGMELQESAEISPASMSRRTTPFSSRPASIYPTGDFRNSTLDDITEIKSDVMLNWLHQQQMEHLWAHSQMPGEGVVLKKSRGNYGACPRELEHDPAGFFHAVVQMNVKVAMTVNTRVIKLFLRRQENDYIPLSDGLRLQILPDVRRLPYCQKHHFAAFIMESASLVVWDDEPKHLLVRAEAIETQLMKMIWEEKNDGHDEKSGVNTPAVPTTTETAVDPETEKDVEIAEEEAPRGTVLINAYMVAATLCLTITTISLGWRELAIEVKVDGSYLRLALLLTCPMQVFLSLFFMQAVIANLTQFIGPISQMNRNSKIYSAIRPRRLCRDEQQLPHVTIQCPVYKEGLRSVIEPTVRSVKEAISTYEMQGGSANIFINDDGMQVISEEDAQARREFYSEHSIAWVSRPKHNLHPQEGERRFERKGKFKKASNMNYALMVSNKVEEKLLAVQRGDGWTQSDEDEAYSHCLEEVLEGEDGRAWADGNIRMGDFILLIDSDTRVPSDCLLDAASEMTASPEVGIIQFSSGVMNISDNFFENGITFFTNLIYTAIRYTVSNGDVVPFVGHNAVLRWSALQQICYTDEDGYEKFWSESHVSEDFDMALRLQCAGYMLRLGAYTGDGFKEGVSLTVYDELSRWEKYAYGCNELLFHPIRYWPTRGIFTPLIKKFIFSNMRLTAKITILSYIGTYYAIGAAWILSLANYFLFGWFVGALDKYYLDSFKIFVSLIVVFTLLGNTALAVLRYRAEEKSLFRCLGENFKWILLLTVFLGGISLHISQALLSHMFSVDMSWGSTAKEVEDVTFFEEVPRLLKRFKFTFIWCILCLALMVSGATVFPELWKITDFSAIFPLATVVFSHFFLPIALNPALMLFTW